MKVRQRKVKKMRRGKRYQKKANGHIVFLVVCMVVISFAFINYTYSRYTEDVKTNQTIEVAKFNVKVNDTLICPQEDQFDLNLGQKLTPNSSGSFDIEINPNQTEVSLQYSIIFDMPKISGNDMNIELKYSLDDGLTQKNVEKDSVTGKYTITETMNLDGKTKFAQDDSVNVKIYWKWEETIENPVFDNNTSIRITSIVSQVI